MKLAFTLCSNNYLAQAKTLADSLLAHNPDYKVVIGLVDQKTGTMDDSFFEPHELLPVEEIGIPDFADFWQKYNIIELNTAVKPFYFQHLFNRHPQARCVLYFDPDMFITDSIEVIEKEMELNNAILTPHSLEPMDLDHRRPDETSFLNYGIYNLGFIGVARSAEADRMLSWWAARTAEQGFMRPQHGLYVDQLWMNLAPLFFQRIAIFRHPGANVAFWNLHERRLSLHNDGFVVNSEWPLLFFHFSAYNPLKPENISANQDRFNFQSRPDLISIFTIYKEKLLGNKYSHFREQSCYYIQEREKLLAARSESERIASAKRNPLARLRRLLPTPFKRAFRRVIGAIDSISS